MAAPLHLNFAISIFIELVHKYLLQITKYWLANYKGCGEFCLYFHALNLHCKLLLMARELEIPFMWGERERESRTQRMAREDQGPPSTERFGPPVHFL